MQHITFYLSTFLALIFAAILFGQARENQALEEAMTVQRGYQIKILRAEETNQFTHRLVQRVIVDASSDPALASLLKDNGVQVTYNSSNNSSAPTPTPAADAQN
jgi:type II secretory pathway component GspD/PulD (secretin)